MNTTRPDLLDMAWRAGDPPGAEVLIEDLKSVLGWLRDAEAERDELLAALNAMLTHMGMDEDEWNKPTFDQARAAIANVKVGA